MRDQQDLQRGVEQPLLAVLAGLWRFKFEKEASQEWVYYDWAGFADMEIVAWLPAPTFWPCCRCACAAPMNA
jgi:hypothetical protein